MKVYLVHADGSTRSAVFEECPPEGAPAHAAGDPRFFECLPPRQLRPVCGRACELRLFFPLPPVPLTRPLQFLGLLTLDGHRPMLMSIPPETAEALIREAPAPGGDADADARLQELLLELAAQEERAKRAEQAARLQERLNAEARRSTQAEKRCRADRSSSGRPRPRRRGSGR